MSYFLKKTKNKKGTYLQIYERAIMTLNAKEAHTVPTNLWVMFMS